tara:strand:- start:2590 stop:3420 length:831 start_codon:yes stop_codon:yes gene_type:complete
VLSACSSVELISTEKDDIPNTKPSEESSTDKGLFCSSEWFHYIEGQLHTSDHQGHGPDLGSTEWQFVVESKLNLAKQSDLPKKSTPQWCEYIQQQINERRKLPSLICQKKTLNKVQKTICAQPELSKLEDQLNVVFKSGLAKLNNDLHSTLKAEQRAWIKDRDECGKRKNLIACIQNSYQYRIAELQARYELLEAIEPIFYVCDDRPSDEVIVKFYPTTPGSLIAIRGDHAVFMMLQESTSGALYQGVNARFWEHHGAAKVTWGDDGVEMNCEKMH